MNQSFLSEMLAKKKEVKEVPQVFKTLASITVWLLFIDAWIFAIMPTIGYFVHTGFLGQPDPLFFVSWGLATVQIFLAVVVAKLRQMMD